MLDVMSMYVKNVTIAPGLPYNLRPIEQELRPVVC